MAYRVTFTLDPEAYAFLQEKAGTHRSGSLNELLKREQQRMVAQAVLDANREEAQDASYQGELAAWEWTFADRLTPS